MRGIGLEGRRRSPAEDACVGDALDDDGQREDVRAGAAEEDERHGSGSCGLAVVLVGIAWFERRGEDTYVPGDGVGCSD